MARRISDLRKLFDDPARFRLARALGQPEVADISRALARQIAAKLGEGTNLRGSMPRHKAASWIKAARALGASVHPLAESQETPALYDWTSKTILYDPDQDEWDICRQICHELAHHLLCHPREGAIRRGTELYDDNRESLQHRIAREVEVSFFGKRTNLCSTEEGE